MKYLGIFGAGGQGRETLELALQINEKEQRWTRIFFIIDYGKTPDNMEYYGLDEAKEKFGYELEVFIALGEPYYRKKLYEKMSERHVALTTLIHPSVHIPKGLVIGKGTLIAQGCYLSNGVQIGENVMIQPNAVVSHDVQIGNHSVLCALTNIAGHCKIGCEVFLGLSSLMVQERSIGDRTIIGAGSVICENIGERVIAYGNPARVIRENDSRLVF